MYYILHCMTQLIRMNIFNTRDHDSLFYKVLVRTLRLDYEYILGWIYIESSICIQLVARPPSFYVISIFRNSCYADPPPLRHHYV